MGRNELNENKKDLMNTIGRRWRRTSRRRKRRSSDTDRTITREARARVEVRTCTSMRRKRATWTSRTRKRATWTPQTRAGKGIEEHNKNESYDLGWADLDRAKGDHVPERIYVKIKACKEPKAPKDNQEATESTAQGKSMDFVNPYFQVGTTHDEEAATMEATVFEHADGTKVPALVNRRSVKKLRTVAYVRCEGGGRPTSGCVESHQGRQAHEDQLKRQRSYNPCATVAVRVAT